MDRDTFELILINNTLFIKSSEDKLDALYENVINYTSDNGISGKLHIVVLDSKGKLVYIKEEKEKWKKSIIQKLNLKKYIIGKMDLYMDPETNNGNLIIAISHKKDKNSWEIYHYIISNVNWVLKKVASFKSDIEDLEINTQWHNNNIYLKFKDDNQINSLIYNFKTKEWNYLEKEEIPSANKKKIENNIRDELMRLYYEVERLKNKEILLFKDFMETYQNQVLLYNEIEKLINKDEETD